MKIKNDNSTYVRSQTIDVNSHTSISDPPYPGRQVPSTASPYPDRQVPEYNRTTIKFSI